MTFPKSTQIRVRKPCATCDDGVIYDPSGLWKEFGQVFSAPWPHDQAEESDRAIAEDAWMRDRGYGGFRSGRLPPEEIDCEDCHGTTWREEWMDAEEFCRLFHCKEWS